MQKLTPADSQQKQAEQAAERSLGDAGVICLHGDGSFGQNAMKLDTAVRHKLPLLCVISFNGGWTADPDHDKPGRET